jgi:hypothetical protein
MMLQRGSTSAWNYGCVSEEQGGHSDRRLFAQPGRFVSAIER